MEQYAPILHWIQLRPWVPEWALFVILGVFAAACIYCAAVDLRERIIPNKVTYPMGLASIVLAPVLWENWLLHIVTGLIVFVFFFVLANIKVRGQYAMGMGDVKLYTVAGFLLGIAVIPCIVISTLVGTFEGVAVMIKRGVSQHIAHGHHICLGILAMIGLGIQGMIS